MTSVIRWLLPWGGSTTLTPSQPIPTAIVNVTETVLNVNPRFDYVNQFLQNYAGRSWAEVEDTLWEVVFIAFLVSIPVVGFRGYRRKQLLAQREADEHDLRAAMVPLWRTNAWPTLFGLLDLYLLRKLSYGPDGYDEHKMLKKWRDKRYLRRLTHTGIIPLYIQDGGIDTRQIQKLEISDDLPIKVTLPKYVQSKKRAYFEFLVPYGMGYSRWQSIYNWRDSPPRHRHFYTLLNRLLNNRHGYSVSVSGELKGRDVEDDEFWEKVDCSPWQTTQQPSEVGAYSCIEAFLPFKPDQVIEEGKGLNVQHLDDFIQDGACPLLESEERGLIVRVEVPHYGYRRLDEWVYGIVQELGIAPIWRESTLHAYASSWLRQNGFELPEGTMPEKHRLWG